MEIITENHNSQDCEVLLTNNTTARYLPPINFENEVYLLVVIAIAVLSPVAVVANALVLAAIWRNLSLRTTSYILLAGLAFTDFCTGLISQPFRIVMDAIKLENSPFNSTQKTKLVLSVKSIGESLKVFKHMKYSSIAGAVNLRVIDVKLSW